MKLRKAEMYVRPSGKISVKRLRRRKESKGYLSSRGPEEARPLRFHCDTEQRKVLVTDTFSQKAGILLSPTPERGRCM